jgi:putative transposase
MQLGILALRHQLTVYQRSKAKPRLKPTDRIPRGWPSRVWPSWQEALVFVQPATVVARQRSRFREPWTRLSRKGSTGRPASRRNSER